MKLVATKLLCLVSLLAAMACLGPRPAFAQGDEEQGPAGAAPTALAMEASGSAPAAQGQPRIRIGPGDLLEVSVLEFPELAQSLRVNDSGDATMNLIGRVHLAGLTTDTARALIARKLREENYVVDPQVSVFIREYSTQGVSVVGEVNKPGVYPVLGGQTLLDVIAAAGGVTSLAGPDATIERSLDHNIMAIRFSKDARASFASDVRLYPGDKVIIGRAGLVYVLGDVGRPGGFVMENDGKLTLLEALAMAGGSNLSASLGHAKLIRKTDSGYVEVPIAVKKMMRGQVADPQLQPEDILYIPSNLVKSAFKSTGSSIVGATTGAAIYHSMP